MKTSKFAFEINWPLDLRNLQEQVGKALCYQKLFWPFTVQINCFTDSFCTVRECTFNIQYPEGKCRVVSNSIPGFFRSKSADGHRRAKKIWNEFGSHRENVKWRITRKVRIAFISLFFAQSFWWFSSFFSIFLTLYHQLTVISTEHQRDVQVATLLLLLHPEPDRLTVLWYILWFVH